MAHVPLSLLEREEILVALTEDPVVSCSVIGARIGRHPTTIGRELTRNGGRGCYRAAAADADALARRARPRDPILVTDPVLRARVTVDLEAGFSPAGIAARLRHANGSRVCAETIYLAVYGHQLDVKPRECLRSRRPRRRRRSRHVDQPKTHVLGDFSPIGARPPTVDARIQPGHWEGDLIIGRRNQSALITLIERVTKMTFLADLPCGYQATECLAALCETFDQIPAHLRHSLTWDRGSEMADWPLLTDTFDLPIYFADAHSPWQRGLNEHNNRQLRWWLPRGIDLGAVSRTRLDQILAVLNHQPRRSLDWDTPAHRYDALTVH